jgi:hypothetical protein
MSYAQNRTMKNQRNGQSHKQIKPEFNHIYLEQVPNGLPCRLRSKGVMRYLNELTHGRNTSALFWNPLFSFPSQKNVSCNEWQSYRGTPSKSCSETLMPIGALANKECSWMGTGCLRGATTACPAFYRHIQVPITRPSTLRTLH